jgi:hypothetical protein
MLANLSPLFTGNFLLKLLLTPVILILATQVSRRWGETIGGLLVGLPLTSAPTSLFFFLEQGNAFAARAAVNSILGLIPVAAFCTAYVSAAGRMRWQAAAAAAASAYLAAVYAVSLFSPRLTGWTGLAPQGVPWAAAALVGAVLSLALWALGKAPTEQVNLPVPWWDLPLRVALATGLVVGITAAAGLLGSTWSGLLSPFPVFSFVMASFSHSRGGPAAAGRFMRGVLRGLFGFVIFFVVVSQWIAQAGLAVYGLATAAALGVNGLALLQASLRRPGASSTDRA